MRFLYWVRKDLRILDNQCLLEVPREVETLDIVLSWPADWNQWGDQRKTFYKESVGDFASSLSERNQTLYICESSLETWLQSHDSNYDGLILSRSFNSLDKQEEQAVTYLFKEKNKNILSIDQGTLYSEVELPFQIRELPQTFTAFRKKVEQQVPKEWLPPRLPKEIALPRVLNLPEALTWIEKIKPLEKNPLFDGGESAGLKRLANYFWETDSVRTYKETRNGMIEFDDSTKFSPWLSLGCLSPRTVLFELQKYEKEREKNESTYWVFFELLWRDYFKWLAELQGPSLFSQQGITRDTKHWKSNNEQDFENWKLGQTGQDFVDANMIELLTTGWMSNRGRQNVASYLSKTIKIDWTKGAKWFQHQLIDYDPESNWGNWAYLAGVGVDPRDRVFNVEKQATIYDPDRKYREKYL